jgi:hypothetical protein
MRIQCRLIHSLRASLLLLLFITITQCYVIATEGNKTEKSYRALNRDNEIFVRRFQSSLSFDNVGKKFLVDKIRRRETERDPNQFWRNCSTTREPTSPLHSNRRINTHNCHANDCRLTLNTVSFIRVQFLRDTQTTWNFAENFHKKTLVVDAQSLQSTHA